MKIKNYELKSNVEVIAQQKFEQFYSEDCIEKIKKIVVPNFDTLGKFTALRFIEWCQFNPEGVVSLATGKTPSSFIKWLQFFMQNWEKSTIQGELLDWKIDSTIKPDLSKLILVQMDEYFPIKSNDQKSFLSYINLNYFNKLGFNPKNALLMDLYGHCKRYGFDLDEVFQDQNADLKLKFSKPQNMVESLQAEVLMLIDQFASNFESKIQEIGGIGFFLGGIGPDGHIAFNFRGSEHCSRSRLLPINYESAAVASASFGGIKFIRNKAALTIGLGTITQNPTACAMILADGVGKANVIKDAIESEPSVKYPATSLQALTGSRLCLTASAASQLKTQHFLNLKKMPDKINIWGQQLIINIATEKSCRIDQLKKEDVLKSFWGPLFLQNNVDIDLLLHDTGEILKQKILAGRESFGGMTFLHTSPHPDDALLGCFPIINQLTKHEGVAHYFATMTSGSNTVQNDYFGEILDNLETHIDYIVPLSKNKDDDLNSYLCGVIQKDEELKKKAFSSRMLRNFAIGMNLDLDDNNLVSLVKAKIIEIRELVLRGATDDFIVNLKSSVREWEEDLVWGHFGFTSSNVFHLNLGFYKSKDKNIEFSQDIAPVLNLLNKLNPDVITIAFDPKDGGHATHYKVAEIIAQALSIYKANKKVEVWGYNNVWCKFTPTQANLFFPVSITDTLVGCNVFNSCYKSQVEAAVPSPELDGAFCDLAQKIMIDQYGLVRACLGSEFFDNNKDTQIAGTKGLCFIKKVSIEEFLNRMKNFEN